MAVRNLTVRITAPSGSGYEGVTVRAHLEDISEEPAFFFSRFETEVVLPSVVSSITNADGEAVLALLPNTDLIGDSRYRIEASKSSVSWNLGTITMPDADSELRTLIQDSG